MPPMLDYSADAAAAERRQLVAADATPLPRAMSAYRFY